MDKVYFQKLTYLGSSVTKGDVKETGADFSVYPSEVPFVMQGEMKEDAKRDWHDEDGIDVFYDNAVPPIKDYDLEIACMSKADSVEELRKNVNKFISYLRGDDGKGKVFAVYDTHCGTGRMNVRFLEFDEQEWYNWEGDDMKFLSFKLKFHVDDPRTEVSLKTSTAKDGSVTVTDLTYSK